MRVFYFLSITVVYNIVLLNTLIALMSSTYNRIEFEIQSRVDLQRHELLLELKKQLRARDLQDERMFPSWLHVIDRTEA